MGMPSENNQNTVQGKERLRRSLPLLLFLSVWAIVILAFWCFGGSLDAMGYSILFLYLLLPLAILSTSFFIGFDSSFGHARYLMPLFYGILYLLAEYATFNLANIVANGKCSSWNTPEWTLLIAGIVLSAVGIGLGTLARFLKSQKALKEDR